MSKTEKHESGGHRNPIVGLGFAHILNIMIVDPEISNGAFRLFSLYLRWASDKDVHWWGAEKIAKAFKVSVRSISTWNTELVKAGYITRERRYGHTSYTWIEDITQSSRLKALALTKPFEVTAADMQNSAQLHVQDSAPSIMQDSAGIRTTKGRITKSEEPADAETSLPLLGKDHKEQPTGKEESDLPPGLSFSQSDGVHVVDVDVEPEDTQLTCPDCDEDQEWPRSQGKRNKELALVCHDCGAYFRVHTEHLGRKKTYQLPIVKKAGGLTATVEGVPSIARSFPCTTSEAKALERLWREDAEEVRSLLQWVADDKLIQKWNYRRERVAPTVIKGFSTRKANAAAKRAAPPPSRPPPRPPTDWNAVIDEAALTNADFVAEEEGE